MTRISDDIFSLLNSFNMNKPYGKTSSDDLTRIISYVGKVAASKINTGAMTVDEAEDFMNYLPNGSYQPYLGVNVQTAIEDINTALYQRENRFKVR